MGPCMCGDPFCSSCGPAQGNYKCSNCGKWDMDGGCDDPDACALAVQQMEEAMAKQEEEWAKLEAGLDMDTLRGE